MLSNFRFRFFSMVFAFSVCVMSVSVAHAAQIWVADGVNKTRGWSDVNKTGNSDSMQCWCAAAANIIDFWQKNATPGMIPESAPQGAEEIFKRFNETFIDIGRGEDVAWRWYFGGCDLVPESYAYDFRKAEGARESGRFWEKLIVRKYGWTSPREAMPRYVINGFAVDVSPEQLCAQELAETFLGLLKNKKPIALSLSSGGKFPQGHVVTVWAMEYQGDRIKSLYITDSDDHVTALQKYHVAYVTSEETGGDGKPDGIPFFKWKKTTIYLQKYHGSNGYALQSWSVLNLPFAKKEKPKMGINLRSGTKK